MPAIADMLIASNAVATRPVTIFRFMIFPSMMRSQLPQISFTPPPRIKVKSHLIDRLQHHRFIMSTRAAWAFVVFPAPKPPCQQR